MPKIRRMHGDASEPPELKVLTRPTPKEPGTFGRARTIGDFVILRWETAFGTIGWAHPLKAATPSVRWLVDAVSGQFRERMHMVTRRSCCPRGA